jgi:hypothetical protein
MSRSSSGVRQRNTEEAQKKSHAGDEPTWQVLRKTAWVADTTPANESICREPRKASEQMQIRKTQPHATHYSGPENSRVY